MELILLFVDVSVGCLDDLLLKKTKLSVTLFLRDPLENTGNDCVCTQQPNLTILNLNTLLVVVE